ncbi:MAG: hypothetical protein ACK400_06095, partial [Pseudanabaena sp.]
NKIYGLYIGYFLFLFILLPINNFSNIGVRGSAAHPYPCCVFQMSICSSEKRKTNQTSTSWKRKQDR